MSKSKEFTICINRRGIDRTVTGTLQYLIEYFGYTLECGKSWEHEKGNAKINTRPGTAKALVKNLNNASNNAAANGHSGVYYTLEV